MLFLLLMAPNALWQGPKEFKPAVFWINDKFF